MDCFLSLMEANSDSALVALGMLDQKTGFRMESSFQAMSSESMFLCIYSVIIVTV